jgi:hypothetical protein
MKQENKAVRHVIKPKKGEDATFIIQSWILTSARYNFSVYEKRILYRVVEYLQYMISADNGKVLKENIHVDKDLFGDYMFTVPVSEFLNGEDDHNHIRVKQALKDLRNKSFEYEDSEVWECLGIIESPKIQKYAETVSFRVTERLFGAFLSFAKGHKKYELTTVFKFESQYAMRFYELLAGQTQPLHFSIDYLKEMFGLSNKYKQPMDFIKWVVTPAKEELDKNSPYSFRFETDRERGESRKATSIYVFPYMTGNKPYETPAPKASPMWKVERYLLKLLQERHGFTTETLKNNIDLINDAESLFGIVDFLQKVEQHAREKGNEIGIGYKINALKTEVEKCKKK